jgi:serine/threonine-protein kinase
VTTDLEERLQSAIGGRYRLEREIGRGGMAIVYLAEDLKHHRKVALKVLHPEFAQALGAKRFLKEIEIAAALSHPHILPLYDSGEADGFLYYVMPYVEGDSLRDRLKRETQLSVGEALRITREVADGLSHAHSLGVVHRDIKPENILLSGEHALIADFGIARAITEAAGEKLTETGLAVGTASYMSPEQARGERNLDGRTDVYSLGCVLYELLAGNPPFMGPSGQAVLARQSLDPVPRLRTVRGTIPEGVERAVLTALAKVPADRFRTAQQFAEALSGKEEPHQGRPRPLFVGIFAVALIIGLAGLYVLIRGQGRSFPSDMVTGAAAPGVAVLPFSVAGSELQEWREGLVNLISTGLDGAGGLRAIDSRTVFARWDERARGSVRVDQSTNLEIARETGARYALLGSAVAIGPEVRLVGDVYEVETGVRLGQGQIEGPPDSVLTLVDRLVVEVLGVILERGEGELPPVNLTSITTTSVPALKAYLEGEVFFRRAQLDAAIEAYTRAVEADPAFGLAHYHLASSHAWRANIQSPEARRHREAALRLVDRLPEREAALVRARYATGEQQAEAVVWLEEAVRKYPDDAEAWFLLGDAHLHTSAPTGPEEADRAFQRATELDPAFAPYQPHGVELAFNHHTDSTLADARLRQYGRVAPGSSYYSGGRLALALAFGSDEARSAAFAVLDTVEVEILPAAQANLKHPRHWQAREGVLLALRERLSDSAWKTTAADLLASGSLWKRGHLRRALDYLNHPAVSAVTRVCLPAIARGWGVPIPERVLEGAMAMATEDREGPLHFLLACRGYIAADLGRWDVHAATIANAEELAEGARAEGDIAEARRLEAAGAELRGYAAWRRGDPSRALSLLEEAHRVAWYLGDWPRRVHRKAGWYPNAWSGHIYQEMNEPAQAGRYLRGVWYNPLARYRQGQIHEAIGEWEQARQAYEYFVEAWTDADSELQPWVEDAREAIWRVNENGGVPGSSE